MPAAEMPPAVARLLSQIRSASGEGAILVLLSLLDDPRPSVGALAEALGMAQSSLSSHLKRLCLAGLVEPRRSGRNVSHDLTAAGLRMADAVADLAEIGGHR